MCVAVVPGMRSKRACLCSFATAHEQSPSRQIIETDIAGTGSNFQGVLKLPLPSSRTKCTLPIIVCHSQLAYVAMCAM